MIGRRASIARTCSLALLTDPWVAGPARTRATPLPAYVSGLFEVQEQGEGGRRARCQRMTVVVDHDTGRLVWAAVGRDKATLARFFDLLGDERCAMVRVVTADGATWIGDVVKKRLKNAVLCIDSFHVCQWASDALDEVRREVWNQARRLLPAAPRACELGPSTSPRGGQGAASPRADTCGRPALDGPAAERIAGLIMGSPAGSPGWLDRSLGSYSTAACFSAHG